MVQCEITSWSSSAYQGGPHSIGFRVTNNQSSTTTFECWYKLKNMSTQDEVSSSKEYITLAPSEVRNLSLSLVVPSNFPLGKATIFAYAWDTASSARCTASKFDSVDILAPPEGDCRIDCFTQYPPSVNAGDSFTIRSCMKNFGSDDGCWWDLYDRDEGSYLGCGQSVWLNNGETYNISVNLTAPASKAPVWRLRLCTGHVEGGDNVRDDYENIDIDIIVPSQEGEANMQLPPTYPSRARAGDTVNISVNVVNDGGDDNLKVELYDENGNLLDSVTKYVNEGDTWRATLTTTMPNHDLRFYLVSYHEE